MKKLITILFVTALSFQAIADDKGFEKIFDGKTLKGWNGNPKFWSVKNGAITGQTTKENPRSNRDGRWIVPRTAAARSWWN